MIDVEYLLLEGLRELLGRTRPGAVVLPAVAGDTDPETELVVLTPIEGRPFGSGHRTLAQEWDLALAAVAPSHEGAFDLAVAAHTALHALAEPVPQTLPGVGSVAKVIDAALPVRTATTALGAQNLTQFDATYTVVVRPT